MKARGLVPGALVLTGLAVAGSPATASEADDRREETPGRVSLRFDVDASRFSGDYGSDTEITLEVLTTRLRWRWQRVELRLGLPYVRLDGGASLVSGVPTPVSPPGGPGPPGGIDPPMPASQVAIGGTESGLGDAEVRLDVDLVTGTARRPWLTALGRVKLPTADESKGLGTGEPDLEGGLLFFQPAGRFGLFLEGRYTRMGDPPDFDYDDVVRASAGISRALGSGRGILFYAFWESRTHPVPGLDDRRDLMLGASTRVGARGRVRLSGGVYAGLSETAEDWGSQFTLGF